MVEQISVLEKMDLYTFYGLLNTDIVDYLLKNNIISWKQGEGGNNIFLTKIIADDFIDFFSRSLD